MSKPICFEPEAFDELLAAVLRYESQRAGLGNELRSATLHALGLIQDGPSRWSLVPGVPTELGTRRVLLQRFPYGVIYMELPSEIRVLAFAHARRRPGYWRRRIPRRDPP